MSELYTTNGAARYLGCSVVWIQKLAARGKIPAYIYNSDGKLTLRTPQGRRQGQGLFFYEKDLAAYTPSVKRRPRGGGGNTQVSSSS